jgi:crossover junction endodeoxyribonuclease RuvC
MLTLGIDPGTASLGYGFVREHDDGSLACVAFGVIRTKPDKPMPLRLQQIYRELVSLVQRYQPDRGAVEELFFARNVTTAMTVAQARGVVLLALQNADLAIAEYKPNAIKLSISGYGGADKTQMQEMVRILLALEQTPRPDDAADALAVAVTDLHSYRLANVTTM